MSEVYAIEGNVVDRVSTKNGKGWCENVSPTLNTQDRHAVVYAIEGNGARPSHMGKGFSGDGVMYTLNTIEQHSVCYAIENHPCDSRVRLTDDGIVQTLNARMGTGGGNVPMVLMTIEGTNSNSRFGDDEISPTVIARCGTGGGNVPIMLMEGN